MGHRLAPNYRGQSMSPATKGPRQMELRGELGRRARMALLAAGCLLLPTFSNSPKLGTSVGALAGYLRKFDSESQVSIFGASAQYTSTDSATAVLFARTSFGADQHRLNVIAVGGRIKNDYDDFLGTGVPLKSEDHVRSFAVRYLYRVKDDWFVGAQALSTNYEIVGQTALDDDLIGFLGLTGFKAGGVGLVGYHDSRDLQDAPKRGWVLNFNSVAYRQSIEGSDNFDVYRLDYRHFWSHGEGHVLALRQSSQWTHDAALGAYAPVLLRGYTMGDTWASRCPRSKSRSVIGLANAGRRRSSAAWHACTAPIAVVARDRTSSRAWGSACSTS
jgi:hypothetical protein